MNTQYKKQHLHITHELKSVKHNLEKMRLETESQFIFIGNRLGDFTKNIAELEATTQKILHNTSGDASAGLLKNIDLRSNQLKTFIKYNIERLSDEQSKLTQQISHFKEMDKPLDNLINFLKRLKWISMMVKLEDARIDNVPENALRNNENIFQTLANDISSLQDDTHLKMRKIISTRQQATAMFSGLSDEIAHFNRQNEQLNSQLIKKLKANLFEINSHNNQAMQISQTIFEKFKKSEQGVNEVIVNLQFNDIIRQKIEHVSHALEQLIKTPTNSEKLDHQEPILHFYALLKLQKEQLMRSRDEVNEAIDGIKLNLATIKNEISQANNQINSLSKNITKSHNQFIGLIGKKIEEMALGIIKIIEKNNLVDAQFKDVTKILNEITASINDIDTVGLGILSLISINGKIYASKLQTQDKTLSTITSEINNMVTDTASNIHNLQNLITKMTTTDAATMRAEYNESDAAYCKNSVSEFISVIQSWFKELRTISSHITQDAQQLHNRTFEFNTLLSDAINNFSVENLYQSGFNRSIKQIEEIELLLNNAFGPFNSVLTEKVLEEHKELYTMEDERLVHGTVVGKHAANIEALNDNIEFF